MKKMYKYLLIPCICCFTSYNIIIGSATNTSKVNASGTDTLSTPNPIPEAVALYRYLLDMNGNHTLSGTMWVPWGVNEVDYTYQKTGKYPAIAGFDFINQSSNSLEIKRAREYWKAGGISTIMWHWGAPGVGEGYEASKATIEIDSCFTIGTPEYYDFWDELEAKANLLQNLRDSGVPVLWRPYHELDGGWFWWSKGGPERFKLLWRTMYDYFVNDRGLNNLIWVLCYTTNLNPDWYPGDEYVDIIGCDTYEGGSDAHTSMYNGTKAIVPTRNIPITYHECGVPPNPDQCLNEKTYWSWWMEWHTDYLTNTDTNYLEYVYNHESIITRDELPAFMETYNWDGSCSKTIITPKVKIEGGEWQETNRIYIGTNKSVTLKPAVSEAGTWEWSGYTTSGSDTAQVVTIDTIGLATATFTNACGAITTSTFQFVKCLPSAINFYVKIGNNDMKKILTSSIVVDEGNTILFSPQAEEGGTWGWSGCVSGNTREVTYVADTTTNVKVVYTNSCGEKSEKSYKISVRPASLIENKEDKTGIVIYPLPCKEYLNIRVSELLTNDYQINVYSLQGILVQQEYATSESFQLNVSKLKPGMYFIKVMNGRSIEIKGFIKTE